MQHRIRTALNRSSVARALLLIPILTAIVSAQTFRETILGTVTDPNGAVVPGASITVKNTSTGLERSVMTDEFGNYTVTELPIGPYEVRVEHAGFVRSVVSNVAVEVASERRVDVSLRVAGGETLVMIAANTQVEITYIANEGVLISSGGKQVLIDGLHREYERSYAFLPPADREKIETAKAPFDKIDLILVSHRHLDHFHPESIGLHLQHNPKAQLVSSQQVVDEVEKNFKDYQAIAARMTAATPPWKERVAMKVAGIDFEILRLSHGTGRHATIQNLGHIIKLGGKKLLHVGDADTAVENFERFNLDEEQIDIAFIPYWFLTGSEGQTIVKDHIKPRQIIAVHISPDESERTLTQIKQLFPGSATFTTMLEKRTY